MNYIEAIAWLDNKYPWYSIEKKIRVVGLAKSLKKGGPYIGPRGGKYKDPQHKIPWEESTQAKPKKIKFVKKEFELDRGMYGKVKVKGYTVGSWGIHKEQNGWSVDHTPTGNSLMTVGTIKQAKDSVQFILDKKPKLKDVKETELKDHINFLQDVQRKFK